MPADLIEVACPKCGKLFRVVVDALVAPAGKIAMLACPDCGATSKAHQCEKTLTAQHRRAAREERREERRREKAVDRAKQQATNEERQCRETEALRRQWDERDETYERTVQAKQDHKAALTESESRIYVLGQVDPDKNHTFGSVASTVCFAIAALIFFFIEDPESPRICWGFMALGLSFYVGPSLRYARAQLRRRYIGRPDDVRKHEER